MKDEFKITQTDKSICPVCGGVGGWHCKDRSKKQRRFDKIVSRRRSRRILKQHLEKNQGDE